MYASAIFTAEGQQHFADLSGDRNPMHMDALYARRTQAGAPVVHGIHSLLRGLELFAAHHPDLPPLTSLKANFNKLIYVGDSVDYRLKQMSAEAAVIDAMIEDVEVSRFSFGFGQNQPAEIAMSAGDVRRPLVAIDRTIEDIAGLSGRVSTAADAEEIAAAFPAVARIWGASRLRATIATTVLVGMVCPGLHSIYGRMNLNACPVSDDEETLSYRVLKVDPRFRIARMQVVGGGISGSVDSFVRMPPTPQPAMEQIAGLVRHDEFAGSTSLIIGGSRGLGELTAKVLAAGGADVVITYAAGRDDALACADEIRKGGGKCEIMPYDVLKPAYPQMAALPPPTHLYYFATPPIARRKAEVFVAARYAELQAFYVTGFYETFKAAYAISSSRLTAFYPSTVFVETRPAEMTEYAMAKMAGELLAEDITRDLPGAKVIINRLPRLPTDQTATVIQSETAEPTSVMLPVIREVQRVTF